MFSQKNIEFKICTCFTATLPKQNSEDCVRELSETPKSPPQNLRSELGNKKLITSTCDDNTEALAVSQPGWINNI